MQKLTIPFIVSVKSSGGRQCNMVFHKGNPKKIADGYASAKKAGSNDFIYESVSWKYDYSQIGK